MKCMKAMKGRTSDVRTSLHLFVLFLFFMVRSLCISVFLP